MKIKHYNNAAVWLLMMAVLLPSTAYASATTQCVDVSFSDGNPFSNNQSFFDNSTSVCNVSFCGQDGSGSSYAGGMSYPSGWVELGSNSSCGYSQGLSGASDCSCFDLFVPSFVSITANIPNFSYVITGPGTSQVVYRAMDGGNTPSSVVSPVYSPEGLYNFVRGTPALALLSSSWNPTLTVSTPGSVSHTGAYSFTSYKPGAYTITWNVVAGYVTPPTQTLSLLGGETITFTSTYVPSAAPTVNVFFSKLLEKISFFRYL